MRFRKLRIAWSVGCGILCLLLIVLWVRSYWWMDYATLQITGEHLVRATSAKQRIILSIVRPPLGVPQRWSVVSNSIAESGMTDAQFGLPKFPGFSYGSKVGWISVVLPHWFPLLVVGAFGMLPWLPWRFSLRTLMIAATLVAVVLGLAVWVARN